MQARHAEIRQKVDWLLRDNTNPVAYDRPHPSIVEAQNIFTIPIEDYTADDWRRASKIFFGIAIAKANTEIYYQQAMASLSQIPVNEFTILDWELLMKFEERFYDECHKLKHFFPTLASKQQYIEAALKKIIAIPAEERTLALWLGLSRWHQKIGFVLTQKDDWLQAKSHFRAAFVPLIVLAQHNHFEKSIVHYIFTSLKKISLEETLEHQLYDCAAELFSPKPGGEDYRVRLLKFYFAIIQQPTIHLISCAPALSLLMQLIEHYATKGMLVYSLSHWLANPEQLLAYKAMIQKLPVDSQSSLVNVLTESGAVLIGMATKIDQLERRMGNREIQFALFAHPSEERNSIKPAQRTRSYSKG